MGLGWIVAIFGLGLACRSVVYQACIDQNMMHLASHWTTQMPNLCEGFFLGVLIAQNMGEAKAQNSKPWLAPLIFAPGLLLSAMLVLWLEANRANYWQSWHFPVLFRPAIAIAFALIVWSAAQSQSRPIAWLRLLAHWALTAMAFNFGICRCYCCLKRRAWPLLRYLLPH